MFSPKTRTFRPDISLGCFNFSTTLREENAVAVRLPPQDTNARCVEHRFVEQFSYLAVRVGRRSNQGLVVHKKGLLEYLDGRHLLLELLVGKSSHFDRPGRDGRQHFTVLVAPRVVKDLDRDRVVGPLLHLVFELNEVHTHMIRDGKLKRDTERRLLGVCRQWHDQNTCRHEQAGSQSSGHRFPLPAAPQTSVYVSAPATLRKPRLDAGSSFDATRPHSSNADHHRSLLQLLGSDGCER
jgi:hypothetical protein